MVQYVIAQDARDGINYYTRLVGPFNTFEEARASGIQGEIDCLYSPTEPY